MRCRLFEVVYYLPSCSSWHAYEDVLIKRIWVVSQVKLLGAQQRLETIERADRARLKDISKFDEGTFPHSIRAGLFGINALIQKLVDTKEPITDIRIIKPNPMLPALH